MEIILSIILVATCLGGILIYSYYRPKIFAKKVAKCKEEELQFFSQNYEFKNVKFLEKCLSEIENEIVDHRSKFKLTKSYLNREEWKIKKIQTVINKYVTQDKRETKKYPEFSKSSLKSKPVIQDKVVLPQTNEKNLKNISNKFQNRVNEFTKLELTNWNNRFVLIDFETANNSRASICQIGMIVVENNQIIFEYSQLVKPDPFYFEPLNIEIHGITEEMVQDAKIFPQIWEEIKLYFNGDYIILAHNAAFDIAGVLKQSLSLYQLNNQSFNYGCTFQMIKKNPHLTFPNYKLATLAQSKNIQFQHHDALEDSLVLLKIINEYYGNVQNFYECSINQYQYRLKQITKNEGFD